MYKRILILPALLMICMMVNSRDPQFKPTTHFGITGGLNFSSVSFKPVLNQSLLASDAFGIVFRHVSEPNIGLQIEISSWGKGWKEVIDSVGTYTRRLKTINIPVTAAFIAGSKTIRFAFTVGPYVSYLRDEKEENRMLASAPMKPHYGIPVRPHWEFGFTGGISAEVHTGIGAFAVRASYSHALSNLFPLSNEYYFSASRSRVIHAGVMYFYSF